MLSYEDHHYTAWVDGRKVEALEDWFFFILFIAELLEFSSVVGFVLPRIAFKLAWCFRVSFFWNLIGACLIRNFHHFGVGEECKEESSEGMLSFRLKVSDSAISVNWLSSSYYSSTIVWILEEGVEQSSSGSTNSCAQMKLSVIYKNVLEFRRISNPLLYFCFFPDCTLGDL